MSGSRQDDLDAEARTLLADPRWDRLRAHANDCDDCAATLDASADLSRAGFWRRLVRWLTRPWMGGIATLALAGVVLVAVVKRGSPTNPTLHADGIDRNGPAEAATVTLLCGDRKLVPPLRCRVGEELSVTSFDTGGGHDRATLTLIPGPSGAASDSVALAVTGHEADLSTSIPLLHPGTIQIVVTWTHAAPGTPPEARAVRSLEVAP